ncbi:hypothetical protein PVIIG_05679 [Plasmodium vivax India VII]|uniref:Variable surface protein Vir35 n=1 Tax=Plasmodium vivax India VII TaxID=1077284 RepID=A0A0J9UTX3_PLAVI|nr:hypothetical protein PVIIG_05679 [Plasmodium vivax India VII]
MVELKNYSMKGKMKFNFLFNIFMFIFLTWICHMNNDACTTNGSLEIKYKIDRNLNISLNRLLAKHDIQRELKQARLKEKISDHRNYHKMKDNLEVTPTYRNLKRKDISDLDNYKKCYKNRYSKKKGLAKLDCYYEKKVFDKIDEIYELSRKMNNDKKGFKKKIYNKFGYRYIFFSLFPILGIIFYIVFDKNGPFNKYCLSDCPSNHGETSAANAKEAHIKKEITMVEIDSTVWKTIEVLHGLIFNIFAAIFIFWIIYTLIKIIKYERLKYGKAKMSVKEYCRFCKDLFYGK